MNQPRAPIFATLAGFLAGVVLTFSLVPQPVQAQKRRIPAGQLDVGNETLSLGAPKSRVLAQLSATATTVAGNTGDTVDGAEIWDVKERSDPSKTLGSLLFKGDVLTGITRQWTEVTPDVQLAEFLRSLYGAVESAAGDSRQGSVVFGRRSTRTHTMQTISGTFDHRTFETRWRKGTVVSPSNLVTIEESIRRQ